MKRRKSNSTFYSQFNMRIIRFLLFALFVSIILNGCMNSTVSDGIPRAEAYRVIALANAGDQFEKDGSKEKYSQYADYLYKNKIISSNYSEKELASFITVGEVKEIYSSLPPDSSFDSLISGKKDTAIIRKADFFSFFDYYCACVDTSGVVIRSSAVFCGMEKDGDDLYLYAQDNTRFHCNKFTDIDENDILDCVHSISFVGSEIIRVGEVVSKDVSYSNTYVLESDSNSLTVLIFSTKRIFKTVPDLDISKITPKTLCNISIKDGLLSQITVKRQTVSAKVLSVDENKIEIAGHGTFAIADDFVSYDATVEGTRESLSQIIVGSDVHEFYIEDEKISAAVKNDFYRSDYIRVLIKNNNYSLPYHYTISLSGETDLTVTCDGKASNFEAGKTYYVDASNPDLKAGKRIFISGADPEKEIKVTSITRSQGSPGYQGTLEIIEREGVLYLINDISLENYLRKVVPSEMPSSYSLEALKAQTVCARTYASWQMFSGSNLKKFGAQVDDSDMYQVYNNLDADKQCDTAIKETESEKLKYNGEYVQTVFFSTSCGVTATAQVWGNPSQNYPYLVSSTVTPKRKSLDLETNEEFSKFLSDTTTDAYEKNYAFYRWSLVTNNKILNEKNTKAGNIRGLTITRRSEGGAALEMRVDGEDGSYTISGADNIRKALGNPMADIVLQDGTVKKGWNSLPSPFIVIETSLPDENDVITFTITGGGYGHGVGMSQNAAQEMALKGMDCDSILKYFFPGSETVSLSEAGM